MAPNEFAELIPLAENLNAKSNEINQTLALVNEKLAALNIGLEVWVGPWEQHVEPYQIGYSKIGDVWELATRTCEAEEIDSYQGKEWVAVPGSYDAAKSVMQASRNIRIETLELLPKIIAALKQQIGNKLGAIQNGKKIAALL